MPLLGGFRAACGTVSTETSVCGEQAVFCQKTAGRLRRQLMPVSHGGQSAGEQLLQGGDGTEQGSEREKERVGESSCQKRSDPGEKGDKWVP